MSFIVHFTLNQWEAVCRPRWIANMTSDPSRVTCNTCSKMAERVARAKHKPAPVMREVRRPEPRQPAALLEGLT